MLFIVMIQVNKVAIKVGSGQWAVGSGQWAVGSGQWAVGSGQWAVGSGQWAVGSGQWAVGIKLKGLGWFLSSALYLFDRGGMHSHAGEGVAKVWLPCFNGGNPPR